METLEQEYAKLRSAIELIIPVISDKIAEPEFQQRILQARKTQLAQRALENYPPL
jgi:hypothetical protein